MKQTALAVLLLLPRFSAGLAVEFSSCFISVLNLGLYVCCFGALLSRSPSAAEQHLMYVYEMQQNLGRELWPRQTGLRPQ